MNIVMFPGTAADYRAWLGYSGVITPTPLTLEQRVNLEREAKKKDWKIQ